MSVASNKSTPLVDAATVRSCPPLYQLLALVLEQRGELKIIRDKQENEIAGDGHSRNLGAIGREKPVRRKEVFLDE